MYFLPKPSATTDSFMASLLDSTWLTAVSTSRRTCWRTVRTLSASCFFATMASAMSAEAWWFLIGSRNCRPREYIG
jgi:hypothetical protein